MGVKFGVKEGTFGPLHPKFHPIGATCRPCGVKNPKIGMSNLNNRRFALRAKLPVNKRLSCHREGGARNMYIRHMSVLQMHGSGSMKNLEKTPGGGLSTIPARKS